MQYKKNSQAAKRSLFCPLRGVEIKSADIDQEGIRATDICDVLRVILSKAFPKAFSQPVNLNVFIPTLSELCDVEGYFDG